MAPDTFSLPHQGTTYRKSRLGGRYPSVTALRNAPKPREQRSTISCQVHLPTKTIPLHRPITFSSAQERWLHRRDVRETKASKTRRGPHHRAREPERGTVPLAALVCTLAKRTLLATFQLLRIENRQNPPRSLFLPLWYGCRRETPSKSKQRTVENLSESRSRSYLLGCLVFVPTVQLGYPSILGTAKDFPSHITWQVHSCASQAISTWGHLPDYHVSIGDG